MIAEMRRRRLLAGGALCALVNVASMPGAMAQDQAAGSAADDQKEVEEVVVTGSRIRRTEFTSASPIQIISGSKSREVGLFDTAEMIQSSAQASGFQIDNTFTAFVLDNGPGAATLAFRGLDPERTLVLLNGRRIAPAGVGGAPTSPDLNLIPSIMIDRVENLLDGASAVYGSDAIAGVANIIMRKDVDGFEIEGSLDVPTNGGGEELTVSGMWGATSDRGSVQIAAEYYRRKTIQYKDRDFTNRCDEYYYEDRKGNILSEYRGLAPGTSNNSCKLQTINRMYYPAYGIFGNLWYTPGFTNLGNDGSQGYGIPFAGVPNWSDTTIPKGLEWYNSSLVPVDANQNGFLDSSLIDPDGDGKSDVDLGDPFYNAGLSDRYLAGDLIAPLERFNAYASGEYTLDDDANTTLYTEGMFSKRWVEVFSPGATLFPDVPVDNPFNPCGIYGVDCMGFFGPFGAYDMVQPVVAVQGDRDFQDVSVYQYRLVGGVRGDIPFMEKVGEGNWSYDVYASYSRSVGKERQTGVREDRLNLSLTTTIEDPNNPGNYICGKDRDKDGIPDGTDGCVPVNMFADSLYQAGGGTFGSAAETAWLMDERTFKTTIEQQIFSGYITGDLFTLPWNDSKVPLVLGFEHRKDKIASIPNDIAADGLLFAYFSDQGATGSRSLNEFFAETELQLLRGLPMAEELTVTASGRVTNETYFDSAWTYSLKGIYRPINWVTLRGTYGTSYRAPNLREQFLNQTTGFLTVVDPCIVPLDARQPINPNDPTSGLEYRPQGDNRTNRVLEACQASGIDPTSAGLADNSNPQYSVEVATGGSKALSPETSRAFTYGFVLEQPFTDAFDLSLSVTFYDIKITNSIEEPGTQFTINSCFDNIRQPNATSEFCNRITRDGDLIDFVDTSFINLGRVTSVGTDFNLLYDQKFDIGAETLGVNFDLRANYTKEQITQIVDDIYDAAGDPEVPHWRIQGRLTLDYSDFSFQWYTRWIEGGQNDPDDFDWNAAPCDGLKVSCRPVYYTKNYATHDASISWQKGDFRLTAGVNNIFDKQPPRVDTDGVFGLQNVPLGVGYDLRGRSIFVSANRKF